MKRLAIAGASALILAGCQSSPPPADCLSVPSPALQKQAALLQTHTTLLQASGAINSPAFSLPAALNANSDRITLEWDGDAVELLAALARQRGIEFVYTGTRLPLPVDINVRDMTFENMLTLIRAQTGWRATLVQNGTSLRLDFTTPLPRRRVT